MNPTSITPRITRLFNLIYVEFNWIFWATSINTVTFLKTAFPLQIQKTIHRRFLNRRACTTIRTIFTVWTWMRNNQINSWITKTITMINLCTNNTSTRTHTCRTIILFHTQMNLLQRQQRQPSQMTQHIKKILHRFKQMSFTSSYRKKFSSLISQSWKPNPNCSVQLGMFRRLFATWIPFKLLTHRPVVLATQIQVIAS